MNDASPTPNQLAENRTDLALRRTIMALERTLMAWLRTAVSLISFGFTIYKILEGMKEKGFLSVRPNAPRNIGLLLIGLGMGMLVVGGIEYHNAKRSILGGSGEKVPFSMTLLASVVLFLIGAFMVSNIIFGIGDF